MRPRDVAVELADMLHEYLVTGGKEGTNAGAVLQRRLRVLADALQPGAPDSASTATGQEKTIFAYWQRALDKPQAKFTADRRAKVRARLREGYTIEQIQCAIDACAASAFHRGENQHSREYVDLTLICQSGSKLEAFLSMGHAVVAVDVAVEGQIGRQRELRELQRESKEQLQGGDTAEYRKTQERIRKLKGEADA